MLKHKSESEVFGSDSVHKRCWKFVKVQAKTRAVVSLVDTNVVEDIAMVSGCWLLHCVVPNHLGPAEGIDPISDHSPYILVDLVHHLHHYHLVFSQTKLQFWF